MGGKKATIDSEGCHRVQLPSNVNRLVLRGFLVDGKPDADSGPAGKGWHALLRLHGPLEPWLDKTWRPGEVWDIQWKGRGSRR